MAEHGGLVTAADLKNYTVKERPPLTGSYRGYSIVTLPPPSSGGVGILQMLGVLEGTGYEKAGAGSATAIHYMAEAMRRYFADRAEHLGDADFVKVPLGALLDQNYILKLRKSIDAERAHASSQVHAGVFTGRESAETTHYTIADEEGNIAAVTYTLNGSYGSKVTPAAWGSCSTMKWTISRPSPARPTCTG